MSGRGGDSPRLSVLMPSYNGGRFIKSALESLAGQPAAAQLELILADDGSTDDTRDVVESYRDRLSIVQLPVTRTGNWVLRTNAALEAAQGGFACLLHQDDVWLPGRLERWERLREEHPEAACWTCAARYIGPAGQPLNLWQAPFSGGVRHFQPLEVLSRLVVQNIWSIPAPIFRTRLARELGGLNPDLWYTADWDFWGRLAQHGVTVWDPLAWVGFRVHPESQTMVRSEQTDDFRQQLELALAPQQRWLEENSAWHPEIAKAAALSVEVNIALASGQHGQRPQFNRLWPLIGRMTPAAWNCFLRDSRLLDRVWARLLLKWQQKTK